MIKYECEKCEREVYTEEAIGADVYAGDIRGTSFTFTDFVGGTITITYEDQSAGLQQFCHACMFETIVQCLREKFDEQTLIKMMGWLWKLQGPKFFDPAAPAGPAVNLELKDATGVPEGTFVVKVVPNDDTPDPGSPLSDNELSELYSKGQLSEPRSDFTTSGPTKVCICDPRDGSGRFKERNPACPIHSPGGSTGPG